MIIAVTYQEGQVFQHFGDSEFFKLYQVEGDAVVSARVTGTQGAGHGALAGFLREQGAEVLICGGIGAGARTALDQAGIRLTPGSPGRPTRRWPSCWRGSCGTTRTPPANTITTGTATAAGSIPRTEPSTHLIKQEVHLI